jgi:hypothetical protein
MLCDRKDFCGGQHAPTDAAFEHIKDGIRNLAQINSPLSSLGFRCWKQGLNQRPLRRRQIARIGEARSSHHHTSRILRQVLRNASAGAHWNAGLQAASK